MAGFGVDRPGEKNVRPFYHGVTPIDLVDIGHDALRSLVSERADEKNQQRRNEREKPALCQAGEAKSQAGCSLVEW